MAIDAAALDKLSPDVLAKLRIDLNKKLDETKLSLYKPYPKQNEFHKAGALPNIRERLLFAGNQCISPWTFVETVAGSIPSREAFSETGVRVHALAGESERDAPVKLGILRSIEPAYRFVMASGLFFDSSAAHQVATEQGWMSISQIMSLASGLHYSHKLEDYQASCVAGGYLCDQRLLLEADIFQELPPLQAGALNSTLTFSKTDAEVRTQQCTSSSQQYDHLTIAEDGQLQHAALYAQFAGPYVSQPALSLTDCYLDELQSQLELGLNSKVFGGYPSLALALCANLNLKKVSSDRTDTPVSLSSERQWHLRSHDGLGLGCSLQELHRDGHDIAVFYLLKHIPLIGEERIIAVVPLGYQPIIDAQIPDVHNYKAGGVYHHNCGKTWSAAFETAMHLTGDYPEWWEGRRFPGEVVGWASSNTSMSTRDTVQRLLLGEPGQWGTGAIPKKSIIEIKRAAHGVSDAVDTILVRHKNGKQSRVTIKTYDSGRARWQGESLSFVWFDEEPPSDIYMEGLTRTNARDGVVWMTFTPLQGMSDVVKRFLIDKAPGSHSTIMTIEHALHYSEEKRNQIIAAYPAHEREARANGTPTMGSGRVFAIEESAIAEKPITIPAHWPRICAIDFGWDHPTAMVWLAWDRDTDTVHMYDCYRSREETPAVHAAAWRLRGEWIPVAWPHDGLQHDKGSGEQLAEIYRRHGVKMLKEKVTFPDGGNSVEAGLLDMFERMQTGRMKVAKHLSDFFEEFRMYHRKDGKLVKVDDDIISAFRYGIMGLRHSQLQTKVNKTPTIRPRGPIDSSMGLLGY